MKLSEHLMREKRDSGLVWVIPPLLARVFESFCVPNSGDKLLFMENEVSKLLPAIPHLNFV